MSDESKTKSQLIDELNSLREIVSGNGIENGKLDNKHICDILFDISIDPVAIIQNKYYKRVSKSFHKIFGYTKTDIKNGLKIMNLVPLEFRNVAEKDLKRRLGLKNDSTQYPISLLSKSGDLKHFIAYTSNLEYEGVDSLLVFLKDVSEQKETHAALEESEETARSLLNATNEMALLTDTKGIINDVNDAMANRLGVSAKKLIGSNLFDFTPKEAADKRKKVLKQILKEKKPVKYVETRTDYIYSTSVYPILDSNKDVNKIAIFATDITEQQRIENAYEAVIENTPQGLLLIQDRQIKYTNKALAEISGYSTNELSKWTFDDLLKIISPEYHQEAINRFKDRSQGKKQDSVFEFRGIRKNGNEFWAEVSAKEVEYLGGKAIQAAIIEITDRKKIELELIASQNQLRKEIGERLSAETKLLEIVERYKKLFESSNVGILIANVETLKFTYANPQICEFLGYRESEILKLSVNEIHPQESLDYVLGEFRLQVQGQKQLAEEIPCLRKDGRVIYADVSATSVEIDGALCNIGFFIDITEKIEALKALKDSEIRYKKLVETSPDGITLLDTDGKIVMANQWAADISGFASPSELIGMSSFGFIRGDAVETSKEEFETILEKGETITIELPLIGKDGEQFDIEVRSAVLKNELGEPSNLLNVIRDVTDRNRINRALEQSEKRYRVTIDSLEDGLHVVGPDLVILLANPFFTKMAKYLGYDPDIIGKKIFEAFPFLPERVRQEYESVFKTGNQLIKNDSITFNDITIYTDTYKIPIYDGTEVTHVITLIRDVTEAKMAEEALRKSEERYRVITETAQDSIFIKNLDRQYTFVNPAMEKLLQLPSKDIVNKTAAELFDSESSKIISEIDDRAFKGEVIDEVRSLNIGDIEIVFHTIQVPLRDSDGNITGITGVVRDITDRMVSEKALRESESKYRGLYENVLEGVYQTTPDGVIISANPALVDMLGYDSEEELKFNANAIDLYVDGVERNILTEHLEDTGKLVNVEFFLKRKNGDVITVLENARAVYDDSGKVTHYEGVLTDITEKKTAEKALRESEEHFRLLADKSPNMIFINQKGKVIYVNAQCISMMEYPAEEYYSDDFNFISLIAEEDRDLIRRNFALHAQGHDVPQAEYSLITRTGKRIDAIITTKLIRVEGEMAILGIVTDVTALKNIQNDLIESEKNFKTLAESVNDGYIVSSAIDKHTFINKRLIHILGYDEEVLSAMNLTELIVKDQVESFEAHFSDWLFGIGVPSRYEYNLLRSDGEEIPTEITVAETVWRQRPAVLMIIRDITEQKMVNSELRRASEDLQLEREALENKNIALYEVMGQIDKEKDAIEAKLMAKINRSIIPLVSRLKSQSGQKFKRQIELIESEIGELTTAESDLIYKVYSKLTPRELEICQLIRGGFQSKEIAENLSVSILTIHKHREQIRKKLGLQNKGVNLNVYLQSIPLRMQDT